MKKIRVDRHDDSRVLLTETLPYETPLFFSNSLLYQFDRSQRRGQSNEPALINRLLDMTKKEPRKAYHFKIEHSPGKSRILSVIHPAVQRRYVDFYCQNADLIVYLCSKGSFSLRHPIRVASQYVEKSLMDFDENDLRELGPEEERGGFDLQTKYASSFFEYRQYAHLYRFYQSIELIRLEKRFRHILQFDIGRCFNSIYTHSIAWAVKDQNTAKAYKTASTLEGDFDALMQASNFDETHGILIGPEASRIFAEILLQRVDVEVESALSADGLRHKVDYQVRRYLDDYLVFSVSQDTARRVFKAVEEALGKYKLFLNESKTHAQSTPLMSPQSIAKARAGKALETFFAESIDFQKLRQRSQGPQQLFKRRAGDTRWIRVVEDLKVIERETKSSYEGLVGFCLSVLRSQCAKVFSPSQRAILISEQEGVAEFALLLIEVSSFLYAMDMRVRPTYLLAQIFTLISRALKWIDRDLSEVVHKRILEELVEAIDRLKANRSGSRVELSNLLIVLRNLSSEYRMPERRLAECFDIRWRQGLSGSNGEYEELGKLDYFNIVTLFYYMRDLGDYDLLRSSLTKNVLTRFATTKDPHRDTELTLLFFDVLSCPFVGSNIKEDIADFMSRAIIGRPLQPRSEATWIARYCCDRLHWVDWTGASGLVNALEKKELRTPYGE